MSFNPFLKFKRLNELVNLNELRRPIIILDPKGEYDFTPESEDDDINDMSISLDKADWKVPEKLQQTVDALSKNSSYTPEEKILLLYQKASEEYIYDDNVLSYMRKIEDDIFALPDWYGRDIDENWEKNREGHNRRVCYEISRYLSKSLLEIFKDKSDMGVCILYYEDLTHYFIGLTCSDYDLTLDLDNFDNIKDLTRLKTNLTLNGINILKDRSGKFTNALNIYNQNKHKYAIKSISKDIKTFSFSSTQDGDIMESLEGNASFFAKAVHVLKEKYNIDSQGMYEYMKEIIDIKSGSKSRKKVWKKLKENENEKGRNPRYSRCLLLSLPDSETNDLKKYLIDVDSKEFRIFDEKEFKEKNPTFIPYNELSRDWGDQYDGK